MTDDTPLAPALTSEEWRRAEYHSRQIDDGRLAMAQVAWAEGRFTSVMALANHALPEEHPGKLTWEDWHTLCRTAPHIGVSDILHIEDEREMRQSLYRIAEKIAALLPAPRVRPGEAG